MLGAGGTDDSSQFSGVVSYDVKVHACVNALAVVWLKLVEINTKKI